MVFSFYFINDIIRDFIAAVLKKKVLFLRRNCNPFRHDYVRNIAQYPTCVKLSTFSDGQSCFI